MKTNTLLFILAAAFLLPSCGTEEDATVPEGYPWGDWQQLRTKNAVNIPVGTSYSWGPAIFTSKAQWDTFFPNHHTNFDFDHYDLAAINANTLWRVSKVYTIQDRAVINHKTGKVFIETRFHWRRAWNDGSSEYASHQTWLQIPKMPVKYQKVIKSY